MRKRLALLISFCLGFLTVNIDLARAQDICFANLPASAWQNGEPSDVKAQLNFDLIGKTYSLYPENYVPTQLDVLSEGSGQVTNIIRYEYQGRNCQSRIIEIKKTLNSPTVNYSSRADWEKSVRAISQNFVQEQDLIAKIDALIRKIQATPQVYREEDRQFFIGNVWSKLQPELSNDLIYGGRSTNISPVVMAINGNCYFKQKNNNIDQIFYVARNIQITYEVVFKDQISTCDVTLIHYIAQQSKINANGAIEISRPESIFPLGKVKIQPAATDPSLLARNSERKVKLEKDVKDFVAKVNTSIVGRNKAQQIQIKSEILSPLDTLLKSIQGISSTANPLRISESLDSFEGELLMQQSRFDKITSVWPTLTTITCAKGKVIQKVTAEKPSCPKGFVRK